MLMQAEGPGAREDEMPESDTTSPYEALRRLGAFMAEHGPHIGCHKPDIQPDRITLLCDGDLNSHEEVVMEIMTMDSQELRRAMGEELAEDRAVSF
jgi:hypothetical protein